MGLFVSIVIIVWVVFIGSWWMLSKWFRSSDADKIKNRLLGTQPKREKNQSGKVALFETEQKPRGKLIPQLMTEECKALFREWKNNPQRKVY